MKLKSQVREWKDVLLRGSDPEALNKYWVAFEKYESKVAPLIAPSYLSTAADLMIAEKGARMIREDRRKK